MVVHYELPTQAADFLRRTCRVSDNTRNGAAVALVSQEDIQQLIDLKTFFDVVRSACVAFYQEMVEHRMSHYPSVHSQIELCTASHITRSLHRTWYTFCAVALGFYYHIIPYQTVCGFGLNFAPVWLKTVRVHLPAG